MKTSVALCTYNGEKFIKEQIESILNQTIPVDEIVVCDDGSDDNTLQIVESIAYTTSTKIYIHRNEHNLGPSKNFLQAIDICKNEIVFLSDQDDIWMPAKVETICHYFDLHPKIDAVFTDGELVDLDGNSLHDTLWNHFFKPEARNMFDAGLALESFAEDNHCTGATLAIRKANIHVPDDIKYSNRVLHDYAISLAAINNDALGSISQCLIKYRIHPDQVCGLDFKHTKHNSDWYYFPQEVVYQICNKTGKQARLDFLKFRYTTKNNIAGVLVIATHLCSYRRHYQKGWLYAMSFDSRRSLHHTTKRITERLSGKKDNKT